MKKSSLFYLVMLISLMVVAQTKPQPIIYNAEAQAKYMPDTLQGIFFGMTFSQFEKVIQPSDLEYSTTLCDSVCKLTKHFGVSSNNDFLEQVDFYFQRNDSTYSVEGVPGNVRLFKMVFSFEQITDQELYSQSFTKNKAIKGFLNENYEMEYHFKTADGLEWIAQTSGSFVYLVAKVSGTPWNSLN